jgi:hypothetical protein
MKRVWTLILLAACVQPAFAAKSTAKHPRMTWEQHFQEANTAHDGRLTLDEAKAGYKTIARHFQEIDTNGKGFVTENDIRAWRALARERRHANKQPDPLRPRPAFDQHIPGADVRPAVVPGSNQASAGPKTETVATLRAANAGN